MTISTEILTAGFKFIAYGWGAVGLALFIAEVKRARKFNLHHNKCCEENDDKEPSSSLKDEKDQKRPVQIDQFATLGRSNGQDYHTNNNPT